MSCVVRGCKSHSSRKEKSQELLTFHRFPKDDVKKKEWLNRIGRKNWIPKNHSHMCSKHFTFDSFVSNENMKWRRLRDNAVPTLFIMDKTNEMEALMEVFEERHSPDLQIQGTSQLGHTEQQSNSCITRRQKSLTQMTRRTNCDIKNARRIKMLEKELESSKMISKRRLRKINTLTKQVSRLRKKNEDLYSILMNKLNQENIEMQYI